MTFVSYAQNFEDVMLWRALKHVTNGFYIDVGANDPEIDSVTKAFYERGWHGINIEPLPKHHADLSKERPRDINLQCAVGSIKGEVNLWECDVRGWATTSADVVVQHTASGHEGVFHKVPVVPLRNICTDYVVGEIHFLKIDVEGAEKSVIDGMDFSRFRPWILVVEATQPNSTKEVHEQWEEVVLSANYVQAYADGLNRYYVAEEHADLLSALRFPPNVFDGFLLSHQQKAESRATEAESRATEAESRATRAESRATKAESRATKAESRATEAEFRATEAAAAARNAWIQYQAVVNSRSWRVSAPLRWLTGWGRWFVRGVMAWLALKPGSRPRRTARLGLLHLRNWVLLRPRIKVGASSILLHFPRFKDRISRLQHAQAEHAERLLIPERPSIPELHPVIGQPHRNLSAPVDLESCLTEEAASIFKRLSGGGL